jgi:hypothetical protein
MVAEVQIWTRAQIHLKKIFLLLHEWKHSFVLWDQNRSMLLKDLLKVHVISIGNHAMKFSQNWTSRRGDSNLAKFPNITSTIHDYLFIISMTKLE